MGTPFTEPGGSGQGGQMANDPQDEAAIAAYEAETKRDALRDAANRRFPKAEDFALRMYLKSCRRAGISPR